MDVINQIFEDVLEDIIPSKEELALIENIVEKLKIILKKSAKELNIEYTKIEPQGSTGIKQTQLKNDFDIDLFIGLNYDLYRPKYNGLSKNKIKKVSKEDFLYLCNNWIIKSLTQKEFQNHRLLYAEHPYVTVNYISEKGKVKIDIVLYFDLPLEFIEKKGPITAVDRSPWHGRFVKNNLTDQQKNDVRLLKQFFKACYCYGDKSPVGKVGFIGYSAELLIYHFGTIKELFKNFEKLPLKPLDYYNRSLNELRKIIHFKNDFLLIIDPIDKNRNVASAISERAYKYCNKKIKEFLESPNKDFFTIKPIPEIFPSNLNNFFIIELKNKNEGVHYTISRDKLYSLGDSIVIHGEKEFSREEKFGKILFEVYFENESNEYNLALYCENPIISKTYIRKGPSINEIKHATRFKQKHPNCFEKKGVLWVETKRKHDNFLIFLKDHVSSKIPDNLDLINISLALHTKTSSGKKAIYILKNMVLPFYL
ncbi:MAG: hypothetical protein ACTSQJ_04265 [Promethearchaeota archaeon]